MGMTVTGLRRSVHPDPLNCARAGSNLRLLREGSLDVLFVVGRWAYTFFALCVPAPHSFPRNSSFRRDDDRWAAPSLGAGSSDYDESTTRLVLASVSPRRAAILERAGYRFMQAASGIDEQRALDGDSVGVVVGIAESKATCVSARFPGRVVIAADTSVVVDGEMLGKPGCSEGARRMLLRLRGREHNVITGVCVVSAGLVRSGYQSTRVRFRGYALSELESYVSSGLPLDKAGAYGIQDRTFAPVSSYDGCYLNVVGLPLCVASRLLSGAGILPDAGSTRCAGHRDAS